MPVKAIRVGTSAVPERRIAAIAAASAKVPCSIESTPARAAASMPRAPWAWAATLRPSEWAVSTIARISSSVKCASRPRACCERTPPVAVNLITWAPARESSRTRSAHCTAPVQVLPPESARITSGRKPLTSPWPPMIEIAGPGGDDSRAGKQPLAGRRARSAKPTSGGEPRSRTVVKPARSGDARVLDADQSRHIRRCRPPRRDSRRRDRRRDGRACRSGRAARSCRKGRSAARRRAPGSGRRRRSVMRPSTMVMVEGPCAGRDGIGDQPAGMDDHGLGRGRARRRTSSRAASRRASIGESPETGRLHATAARGPDKRKARSACALRASRFPSLGSAALPEEVVDHVDAPRRCRRRPAGRRYNSGPTGCP